MHPLVQIEKTFETQKQDLFGYLSGLIAGESKAHHQRKISPLDDFGGPYFVPHQE